MSTVHLGLPLPSNMTSHKDMFFSTRLITTYITDQPAQQLLVIIGSQRVAWNQASVSKLVKNNKIIPPDHLTMISLAFTDALCVTVCFPFDDVSIGGQQPGHEIGLSLFGS
jgi:hypothetical protein